MYPNSSLKEMDQQEFEQALAMKLRDPVPSVLQRAPQEKPAQPEYSTRLLQLAAERCLLQLPSTALYSAIGAPAISSQLGDPPQRKESIMCPDKPALNFCKAAKQKQKPPAPCNGTARKEPEPQTGGGVSGRTLHLYNMFGGTDNQRRYVLHELLATEETYVKDLEILVAVFAAPLCEYARSQDLQLEVILHPLRVLFSFQHSFLRAMYQAADTAAVARLFLSETTGFQIYVAYCSRYQWLCSMLDQIETDTAWAGFLKEVQAQIALHSDCRRLGLRDFLIKPVQRICKYPLFIKDLIKSTDPSLETATFADLNHALNVIRGICQTIDQQQQQRNSMQLRQAVIARYRDNPQLPLGLVAKLGAVVLSGPLGIASHSHKNPRLMQTRGCVLFRRFLIIFKVRRSAKITPQYWFPLHTMQLVDRGDALLWQLQHIRSGQLMSLSARTARERLLWTEQLSEAIQSSMIRVRRRSQNLIDPSRASSLAPHMSLDEPPTMALGQLLCGQTADQPQLGAGNPVHNLGLCRATSADAVSAPNSTFSSPLLASSRISAAPAAIGSLAAISSFTADPKSEAICKYFEPLTSPEILRLQTLVELNQPGSTKPGASRPLFPHQPRPASQTHPQAEARAQDQTRRRQQAQSTSSAVQKKLVRKTAAFSYSYSLPSKAAAAEDVRSSVTLLRTGCQSTIASESEGTASATSSAELTCNAAGTGAGSVSSRYRRPPHHSRQQSLWSNHSGWSNKEPSYCFGKQPEPAACNDGVDVVAAKDAGAIGNSPSLGGRLLSLFDNLSRLRRRNVKSAKVSPNIEPCKIDSCCSRSSLDYSGRSNCQRPGSPRHLYPWASVQEASVRTNRVPSSNADNCSQLVLVPLFLASTQSVSKE